MSKYDDLVEKLGKFDIPDIDYEKYYQANADDTNKIKRVVDYFDELEEFLEKGDVIDGAKLPFSKLENRFRFRSGEVTMWSGLNGHKKSMLLGYCIINLLKQKERVCLASFEMKPTKTIIRMSKQYAQSPRADYDSVSEFMGFAANEFYIFDHLGEMSPERLMGIIQYTAKEMNVKHFVIDSLMRVVKGDDDYNSQKDFVVNLCKLAIKFDIHIHFVHHTKKVKEDAPSGRYDAKGSSSLSDNVHNSLIVWSNKANNKDLPDMILKCDKQREGEWEGNLALNFLGETLSFEETYNVPDEY